MRAVNLASLMPPANLSARTGGSEADYHTIGAANATRLRAKLPTDWDWRGKRVLDFGCGTGRTLVHLSVDAPESELWGCEIDEPSIEWAQQNLSPPLHFLTNREEPPIDLPGDQFDVICAFSVFTHLLDSWADWLLEMHRLLVVGGYGVFTFLGEGMIGDMAGMKWDADRIGMLELDAGKPWSVGGPNAIHSEWWLREHWGRLFEVVHIDPYFDMVGRRGQGVVVLLKDDRPIPSVAELKALVPNDPREVASLQLNIELLKQRLAVLWSADIGALRIEIDHLRALLGSPSVEDSLRAELETVLGSKSWKLTAPLRRLRRALSAPGTHG